MLNEDSTGPMVRLLDVLASLDPSNLEQPKWLEGLRVSVNSGSESWYPAVICDLSVRMNKASVFYVDLESGLRCSDCPDAVPVDIDAVRVPKRQVALLKKMFSCPARMPPMKAAMKKQWSSSSCCNVWQIRCLLFPR